jgi:hypothetical protein
MTNNERDRAQRILEDAEVKWGESYNGRSGCACGCRGNYNERAAIVERQRKKMIELLNYAEVEDVMIGYRLTPEGGCFHWVSIETPYNGRVATIYEQGF